MFNSSGITKVCNFGENLVSTGDSEGCVKIWDVRKKKKSIFTFKEQSDEISDLAYSTANQYLLSTSIDGTLSVYDLRASPKFKLYALSDCVEDELHCLKIMEHNKKVVCGTSEGPIALFSWDWFGDYKDRILGHPGSVNCIEKYDENYFFSGCEDGKIRLVSVFRKNIEKMVGDTKKNSKMPKENKDFKDIEALTLSMSNRNINITK